MNFVEQKNYDINSNDSKNFCIEDTSNDFLSKYYILINQYIGLYIENIYDNINITNDKQYRYYIFIKGLEMLSNIMQIIILYTNNIDLAFHYCNKSYYYYLEFISQIDSDNNQLDLTIKDAIIFVYKKSIFEIKEPISTINNVNINQDNILKLDNIKIMINIINSYVKIFKVKDIINLNINNISYIELQNFTDKHFLKIINKVDKLYLNENNYNKILSNFDNILNSTLKIFNKFNIINNDTDKLENSINFQQLIIFIDKLLFKSCSQDQNYNFDNIITRENIKVLNNCKVKNIQSLLDYKD